jgi:magnesium transporter
MVAVLEREFFVSEILGRKVFFRKERIGRLNDVVIVETGAIPEVSNFIVERPFGYPSLLVPWSKIALISATEIIVDDADVSAYEAAPPEGSILLKDHILDKKILDMDDHEVEVVYDVKLVLRGDKLYASEVDFSHNRLLRRLGLKKLANWLAEQNPGEKSVSWMYVQPLPEKIGAFKGDVKLNVLKENIGDIHPVDLADILEELDQQQRLAVFHQLEPEHASDTLEEVEPRVQRELIEALDKEKAADLIDRMSHTQAADVLAALPVEKADELLHLIDPETAPKVQQLIDQHDEHIQLYASDNFIKLPPITIARSVIDDYRHLARDKDVVMYVYVVDPDNLLLGVVDIRELIMAENDQTLAEIMVENVISLDRSATLKDALNMFDRYGFRALPIVDDHDHIVGAVSFKHVRGIIPRLN